MLPVFLLSFSGSFAETGLLGSALGIASLISLPIIGVWADKMPARHMVLISLLLYPLVGISYFAAGVYGLAVFIVIARLINGFTWELENVGIQTYFRRVVSSRKIGQSFGFLDMLPNTAWVAAAIIGMAFAMIIPIHWLLLLIAPFSVIAYFIAVHAPADEVRPTTAPTRLPFFHFYGKTFAEFKSWNSRLWFVGLLFAFTSILASLIYFFIPIDAYMDGANLSMVALIALLGAVPGILGYKIGKIADKHNKYTLITVALVLSSIISVGLVLLPYYWYKLVAIFLAGIVLEIIYIVQSSLITTLGPAESYGERGSAFEGINVLGDLLAPLLLGICLDVIGFDGVSIAVAVVAVVLALIYGKRDTLLFRNFTS